MMRRRVVAALGLVLLGSTCTAACTSEPKDPVEQRKDRVEARIEDTFSRSQASCIMDVLDEPTIEALDRDAELPADSEAMRIYSNAVVACTA
ncbi:hypothetical protein ACE2AJ_19145 [Aquihabitans daechungensis]|uniref:hypothetical protein n=1 Tax=Aquihabitans daechungensis TaxID=1052257 RepID=UPI003BA048F4